MGSADDSKEHGEHGVSFSYLRMHIAPTLSFALLRTIHPWLGRPPPADYRRVLVAPGIPISSGPDLLDNQIRTSELFRAMFNTLCMETKVCQRNKSLPGNLPLLECMYVLRM